jgi:hypothetical protein
MPHHDAHLLGVDHRPAGLLVGTCYACTPPHPLVGDPEQHLIEVEGRPARQPSQPESPAPSAHEGRGPSDSSQR